MEEIDNIIIDSLRNISCNISESIHSLKEFTTEITYSSMVLCLEAILTDVNLPHIYPQSMSLRLKNATIVAEHIKELGYRGDMGYQTIVYCNEIEIRRVLMFLVERLPRECIKLTVSAELGYVPKIIKKLEESIRLSLEKPWVPSEFLKCGSRECKKTDLKQDFGYSYNLQTEIIEIPDTLIENCNETLKRYWINFLPEVTRQCSWKNLIPSMLYRDTEFMDIAFIQLLTEAVQTKPIINNLEDAVVCASIMDVAEIPNCANDIQQMQIVIQETKHNYGQLEVLYNDLVERHDQVENKKNKSEALLKDCLSKIKIRSKTLTVLQNKENTVKLKKIVCSGNKRLVELANHWNDVQSPLLQEYQELKQHLETQKSKVLDEEYKLQETKIKKVSLTKELSNKEILEHELTVEFDKLNKNTKRSAYTRRILEIIANIKKQSNEVEKILTDTKIVQKDINNLNGQLDRSFALSDELIFRDAKRDTMARSAYKLLATLHNDCNEVVQAVISVGLVERESRNLHDQIEAELCREIGIKLERLNDDIIEMKKENALLTAKNKDAIC